MNVWVVLLEDSGGAWALTFSSKENALLHLRGQCLTVEHFDSIVWSKVNRHYQTGRDSDGARYALYESTLDEHLDSDEALAG